MAAEGVAIYDRSIRKEVIGKKRRFGSIDCKQAVYLATTEILVTSDKSMNEMMNEVVRFGNEHHQIWTYHTLLDHL